MKRKTWGAIGTHGRAGLFAVLAAGLAAGCHHSAEQPGGGGGGGGGTSSTACEQTAPLYCQQIFKCSPEAAKYSYGSVEGCQTFDATSCRDLAAKPGASPASIQSWAACNRALAALTCEESQSGGPLEACRFPPGTRKVGEPCSTEVQCASTYCKFAEDANGTRAGECGVCAPALGVGDDCDDVHFCGFGLVCDGQKCARQSPEGGACGPQAASVCQGPFVCVEGRCTKRLLAGAACTDPFQCDGDLRCIDGVCGESLGAGAPCKDGDYTCGTGLDCIAGKCATVRAGGESCTTDSECQSYNCLGDRALDGTVPNGQCTAGAIEVDLGEACSPTSPPAGGGSAASCRYYAFCDETTRRCALRKPVGAACAKDPECVDVLVCAAGKCQFAPEPMCSK
jgi:hypothetical protein